MEREGNTPVEFGVNRVLLFLDFGSLGPLDRLCSLRKKIRSWKGAANENFDRGRRARAAVSRTGKRAGILRKFLPRTESEAHSTLLRVYSLSQIKRGKERVGNAIVL